MGEGETESDEVVGGQCRLSEPWQFILDLS